jgi:hypothetical protein
MEEKENFMCLDTHADYWYLAKALTTGYHSELWEIKAPSQ